MSKISAKLQRILLKTFGPNVWAEVDNGVSYEAAANLINNELPDILRAIIKQHKRKVIRVYFKLIDGDRIIVEVD